MPASMIRAPTGSKPYVTGKSMAIVAIGPTPGSTPINVPTMQPRKASPRFCSVSATLKPRPRFARKSLIAHGRGHLVIGRVAVPQQKGRDRDRGQQRRRGAEDGLLRPAGREHVGESTGHDRYRLIEDVAEQDHAERRKAECKRQELAEPRLRRRIAGDEE